MKQVIQYYENAVTCDPRNFPAKVALIRSLMYSPIENYEKIEGLLDEELANPGWNDNRKAELHFLKGCFLLLTHGDDHSENDVGAALEWLKILELCPTVLNFVVSVLKVISSLSLSLIVVQNLIRIFLSA